MNKILTREDAINWIKEIDKKFKETNWDFSIGSFRFYGELYEGHEASGVRKFLVRHFKLTEEDINE